MTSEWKPFWLGPQPEKGINGNWLLAWVLLALKLQDYLWRIERERQQCSSPVIHFSLAVIPTRMELHLHHRIQRVISEFMLITCFENSTGFCYKYWAFLFILEHLMLFFHLILFMVQHLGDQQCQTLSTTRQNYCCETTTQVSRVTPSVLVSNFNSFCDLTSSEVRIISIYFLQMFIVSTEQVFEYAKYVS